MGSKLVVGEDLSLTLVLGLWIRLLHMLSCELHNGHLGVMSGMMVCIPNVWGMND